MGYRFELEHANFIAYLTQGRGSALRTTPAPRAERNLLFDFLGSLSNTYGAEQTISSRRVISQDKQWLENLSARARELASYRQSPNLFRTLSLARLESYGLELDNLRFGQEEILSSETVASILEPLKEFFCGYELYALIVGSSDTHHEAEKFFARAALSRVIDTLVIMPMNFENFASVVDPFPALHSLANSLNAPPVVVFWTENGRVLNLPLLKAEQLFRRLEDEKLNSGGKVIEEIISAEKPEEESKKILHLSDLHFGNKSVESNRRYLKTHLRRLSLGMDRVVVTGDLLDSPDANAKETFKEFCDDIFDDTGKRPVLVPGNHDVKKRGILARNYQLISDIGFIPLVCDDDLRILFLCFDSNESGALAAGYISDLQRRDMATQLENIERIKPETQGYFRIGVLHHHPIKYSSDAIEWHQKLGRFIGNAEAFEELTNASEFMDWCVARGVKLLLHGHKHIPRNVLANRSIRGMNKDITVIGCGSTTGVHGSPLCYDILDFNPATGRFNISFFQDDSPDGLGFGQLQMIAIDLRCRANETKMPAIFSR